MISALIYLVIYLVVLGLVIWLLMYLIDTIPLPQPFARVTRIVLLVVGVLIAIILLLNFIGVLDSPPRMIR